MDPTLPATQGLGGNGQIRHFLKHSQHQPILIWRPLSRPQEHSLSVIPVSFFELSVVFKMCALFYESYQAMCLWSELPNSSLFRSLFLFPSKAVRFYFY